MRTKDNKGITLVALVVTIIVLLILAGVSLNAVIGNNGLITKAREARENWEDAQEVEKEEIGKLSNELMDYKDPNDSNDQDDDTIEINDYSDTTVLTNSKIDLDWETLVEAANKVAANENITSSTSQVKLKVKGKPVTLTVGDYTSLQYDGVDKKVRLIGFNHDDLADGTGKAGMTFEFITTLGTDFLDSANNIESNGWENWELRAKMPQYLSKIEETVRNNIKPITKKYGVGIDAASGIYSCTDSLWLLGWREVHIETECDNDFGDDGKLYRYYSVNKEVGTNTSETYARFTQYDKANDKSLGDLPNSGDQWEHVCVWLRSVGGPHKWSHTAIEYTEGRWRTNNNCYGTSQFSVAPAFCIGEK